MAWRLAPSLTVLRNEVNTRWPGRDKASDGTVGDTAHAASTSDHNPNSRGSVNAIDIDKDGVTVSAIIAAAEKHPSVHYWIYNRQIADRDSGFARRRYTGPNPHDKHLHISIRQTRVAEDDRRPWGLIKEDDMPLSPQDLDRVRTASAKGLYDALTVAVSGKDFRDLRYSGEGSIGASVRANLTALTAGPVLAALAGLDAVDETKLAAALAPAVAAAVLAGLPEDRDDVTVEELTEAFRRLIAPAGG